MQKETKFEHLIELEFEQPKYAIGQKCFLFDEYGLIKEYVISERKQTISYGKLAWVYKLSDNKSQPKDTDSFILEEYIFLSLENLLLYKANQYLNRNSSKAKTLTLNFE